jgi:hypothetical protein
MDREASWRTRHQPNGKRTRRSSRCAAGQSSTFEQQRQLRLGLPAWAVVSAGDAASIIRQERARPRIVRRVALRTGIARPIHSGIRPGSSIPGRAERIVGIGATVIAWTGPRLIAEVGAWSHRASHLLSERRGAHQSRQACNCERFPCFHLFLLSLIASARSQAAKVHPARHLPLRSRQSHSSIHPDLNPLSGRRRTAGPMRRAEPVNSPERARTAVCARAAWRMRRCAGPDHSHACRQQPRPAPRHRHYRRCCAKRNGVRGP